MSENPPLLNMTIGHADALLTEGHFFLTGSMTEENCTHLGQAMLRYALGSELSVAPLLLYINSPGGIVSAGFALGAVIKRIRTYGFLVNTHIIGEASSMAAIVAQYGNTRFMDASAVMMLHGPSSNPGYGNLEYHGVRFEALTTRMYQMAAVLAANNTAKHNDNAFWENALRGPDWYFTPQQALEYGLIDEVVH